MLLDDKAFEGSGAFLIGAVLDRFFAEYVAINHFTQTGRAHERARRDHALAAASRPEGRLVSFRDELVAEPWRFDMFATLRRLERENADKPRLGDAATLAEEYLVVSQNPYMEFPASNLEAAGVEPSGRMRLVARFLGMFGPQGALPLATTEESLSLAAGARRRVSAFRRHLPAPFHRAVFSRLGGCASDRAKRPARRGSISRLYRFDDRRRRAAVPRRRFAVRFRQDGIRRPARAAGQERLAPARAAIRPVRRAGRDRRVRRRLADARPGRALAPRGAPEPSGKRLRAGRQHVQRRATSFAFASSCAISRNTSASCRDRIRRGRSATRCSSMSARNTTGTWSWRFPPARSRRFVWARAPSSAGRAGWRRIGRRPTRRSARDARFHVVSRLAQEREATHEN